MESKHLIYKNGHFYDRNTRKRIEIADGAELTVVTAYSSFLEPEEVGSWGKGQPHKKEALKQMIENDPDVKVHKKILDKDTLLYFTITHSRKKYEFEVLLSEDLYVYLNHSSKKDGNEGKLYDCACTVTRCLSNNILFFEPVRGKSLNEVYKNTFVHYFGNKGNPACNALNRFYQDQNNPEVTIGIYREIE